MGTCTDGSASGVGPVITGGVSTVGPSPGPWVGLPPGPPVSVSNGLDAQPASTMAQRKRLARRLIVSASAPRGSMGIA